ncbi:hypothetical protein GGQ72_001729 [Rhizobium rhizoryzae]|uniref:Uncharacterized protein n=1 Tax=Rhizobium rhizoryzae TaxID=451876 RepID=A0A7W6PPM3_9HYPH|nr:hypothetical protein [Rhizobium rhizoryzae]
MTTKITTIPGLTFDLIIEEVNIRCTNGGLICYLATIYRKDKGSSLRRVVRRSRLLGAAADMKREIQQDGIRAFRRFQNL